MNGQSQKHPKQFSSSGDVSKHHRSSDGVNEGNVKNNTHIDTIKVEGRSVQVFPAFKGGPLVYNPSLSYRIVMLKQDTGSPCTQLNPVGDVHVVSGERYQIYVIDAANKMYCLTSSNTGVQTVSPLHVTTVPVTTVPVTTVPVTTVPVTTVPITTVPITTVPVTTVPVTTVPVTTVDHDSSSLKLMDKKMRKAERDRERRRQNRMNAAVAAEKAKQSVPPPSPVLTPVAVKESGKPLKAFRPERVMTRDVAPLENGTAPLSDTDDFSDDYDVDNLAVSEMVARLSSGRKYSSSPEVNSTKRAKNRKGEERDNNEYTNQDKNEGTEDTTSSTKRNRSSIHPPAVSPAIVANTTALKKPRPEKTVPQQSRAPLSDSSDSDIPMRNASARTATPAVADGVTPPLSKPRQSHGKQPNNRESGINRRLPVVSRPADDSKSESDYECYGMTLNNQIGD